MTKKLDWEKEFDDIWEQYVNVGGKRPIKDFIQSLLSQQKQEILELESLKEERIPSKTQAYVEYQWASARNQLRSQIKEEIKSLEEEK